MSESKYTKEFVSLFDEMCYKKGLHKRSAWSDLMLMFACDISNITEIREDVKKNRIKQYKECEERLGGSDIPIRLLAILIQALSDNPGEDFLGKVYMNVGMGEKNWGQFFTPSSVASLMSRITILQGADDNIAKNGYTSVADPTVGSGAMLLEAAETIRSMGHDVSSNALFFGQDLDYTSACMAFVQLALTGCAALIVVGNSLTEPYTGNPLFIEANGDYWYTPVLYTETWNKRRIKYLKDKVKRTA